mgnify:CR=1 FL=1
MIPMKTKRHKLASLLLAFALTLCLALPAGAVEGETTPLNIDANQTGNIKVEGISETAGTSVTVNVYQLMTVNFDTANQQPVEPVYTWVKPVANWLKGANQNETYRGYISDDANDNSVTENFSEPESNAANKTVEIAGFYDALAAAIRSGQIESFNATKSETAIVKEGEATASCTIDDLAMGNYLVLIEGGMKVYRPSAVNIVPKWDETSGTGEWVVDNPTVALKAGDATIEKKVTDTADSTQEKPMTPCDWAQVDIGDTVTYQLIADLPEFPENAINKGYQISDTLPNGMTLGQGIEVYGVKDNEAETKLTALTDYTLVTTNAQRPTGTDDTAVDFTVTFTNVTGLYKTSQYRKIKVVYTATANENIKVFGDSLGDGKGTSTGNENTAYLDYNNNPYQKATDDDPLEWVSKEDSAFVYTYGIKVDKVSDKQESGQDVYLPGAEFTLHRTDSQGSKAGDPISFVAVNADDGVYRVAKQTDTGSTKLTVGKENAAEGAESRAGKLDIRGLDVGTYILTETKAPDGYNLPSKAFEIIINDSKTSGSDNRYQDGANGKTDTTDDNNTTEVNDGYVSTKIPNTKGFTLPTTGGMGTVLFTAGGVLLMGAGLVVLVLFLRRRTSR